MKRRLLCACTIAVAVSPAAAAANDNSGGASFASGPSVEAITCADGQMAVCAKGEQLTVSGTALRGVRRVVFLGGKGRRDDRAATPASRTNEAVVVTVPEHAHTGPLALDAGGTRVRSARVKLTKPPVAADPASPAPAAGERFPIAGAHTFGQSTANRFGGRHQGQDVFAACGTPLVAAGPGSVLKAATEANAGNYVVIERPDGTSNAYMHMREPTKVREGDPITAGQPLGAVGDTGRATGCHLHFELWTAPGWYEGGSPIDPLPTLKARDA